MIRRLGWPRYSRRGLQRHRCMLLCAAAMMALLASPVAAQDDDLAAKEEMAIQAAVARVAPSVVRIETLGGLETIGRVLVGTGPTTGLVVSADGYIISSAFNFAQKPAQILVNLTEGKPVPAELVSTDFNRRLVLLKINTDMPLPVPEAVPEGEVQVGQWAIAVGRTYGDGKKLNLSAGIISATNRIWSRAIQTDAKVSPSNYGGPLLDIRGRVLGVLVPLAQDGVGGPGAASEVAGVEWYDSGIGFAVPLARINQLVERMKKEKELRSGLLGVSLKGGDIYSGDVIIASVPGGSPAHQAGFKAGDQIIEVDGAKITRQAELRHALMPRYAGDKLKVVALRGKDRIEREVELVAKLDPYEHPFLGVLPLRASSAEMGVVIRHVYPDSPAAKAGLKLQDTITTIDGEKAANRDALLELMAAKSAGQQVELEVQSGEDSKKLKLELAALPEAIPADLPAAHGEIAPPDGERQATGLVSITVPEAANTCFAYVPETYQGNVPHGVMLWLHAPGGYKEDELVASWKEHCAKHEMILLAPKSSDASKWQRTELEYIRKTLDDVLGKYTVDRKRIVVAGQEGGGAMAYLFAISNRELAQGVVAVDAALPPGTTIPPNDPVRRHAFFVTTAKKSPAAAAVQTTIEQLRAAKYPVTVKDLGETPRPLTTEEQADVARWMDALDRI